MPGMKTIGATDAMMVHGKAILFSTLLVMLLLIAFPILRASSPAATSQASPSDKSASKYFTIQVVDRQTGCGVPLVQLRTTNSIRLFTDSNGLIAFLEPGLMDREVFFFVESH